MNKAPTYVGALCLYMKFLFDNAADLFLVLLIVEMIAVKGIYLTIAVGKSAPAVHVHALHEYVVPAVYNSDIAGELYVLGSSLVALSHTHIGTEYTVQCAHELLIGNGSTCRK